MASWITSPSLHSAGSQRGPRLRCSLGTCPRPSRSWSRARLISRAQGDSSPGEASSPGLSLSEAYKQLGVREGATFEECLNAKNLLLSRYDGDEQKCMEVEVAYDKVLMQQMAARLRGELQVSSKVRFADVPQRRPSPPAKSSKPILSNIPGVTPPRGNDLKIQGAVFGGLAALVLIQDLVQPSNVGATDVPAFQLALAAGASVYFLREQKKTGLGKAFGLTVGGLVVGALLGSLVETWLRVDIVPLGGISAPGTVVGEFALAGLAAVSILLG